MAQMIASLSIKTLIIRISVMKENRVFLAVSIIRIVREVKRTIRRKK